MFNRINSLRSQVSRLLAPRPPLRAQMDPNTPIGIYFEPSGRVRPITLKSMAGFTDGEYNALSSSMNRSSNATASEIGYAYISEVNVWVRRCVEIRASNISRLTWYVEDRRTGKRIDEHPLTIAMQRSRHFFQRVERSLLIWGELYLKPLKNEHDYYSDVQWLNNLSVNLTIVNGFIQDFYYSPLHGGRPFVWPAKEMCYIYTENAFDDLRGSSKVLAVLAEANVHEEIARAAQAHFANDARPGIMFIPETDMGTGRAQEFIDYWKKNFQGSLNTNKPVLLPSAIKSVQVLERAKLEDDVSMRGSIRREICADFGVPLSVAGAWDDANYQSAPEQRVSLYEETIIPEGEAVADDLTRSLLPFFGNAERERVWFDAKNLLALAEDKQQKATALNSQLISGGITLNEYREAMDMEALPSGNVYYIPSSVIVTPVDKLGTLPPPGAPGPFGPAAAASEVMSTAAPADPALPEGTPPTKDAASLSVTLSLANNVDLLSLQHNLQAKFAGQPITWTDPAALHLTLITAPAVDPAALDQLVAYVQAYPVPEMALNIGSLATFDSVSEHALHFRIRRNADLEAFQEDVYLACQQLGIQTVQHSTPAHWIPHVTVGYALQRIPPITFHSSLRVSPTEVQVSVKQNGQYEVVGRTPCGQPTTINAAPTRSDPEPLPSGDAAADELAAYEKFVLNRWGKPTRTFEFHVLPDTVQQELTSQVSACTEKAQAKRLFEGWRDRLKAENEDEGDVVTSEQAQAWWRDYDRLMESVGATWIADYMRVAWQQLQARLTRDISADDVQTLLSDLHPDLTQQWTGTPEDPGVIAKLFMAGMGAGQAALERKRTNMNPMKAAALDLDWSLVPEDAIAAVERYVGRMIRDIDSTTLSEVQRIIADWLASGGTLDDLAQQLAPIFNDPARAELIAATEASHAYNAGAEERWTQAGVKKARIRTVRDSRVCDTCEPLAGQEFEIAKGIYVPSLGKYTHPPFHGRCRCYEVPVL